MMTIEDQFTVEHALKNIDRSVSGIMSIQQALGYLTDTDCAGAVSPLVKNKSVVDGLGKCVSVLIEAIEQDMCVLKESIGYDHR